MSGPMTPRKPLQLDETVYPNGTIKKRSFGFNAPQKERTPKVQHPKPAKT